MNSNKKSANMTGTEHGTAGSEKTEPQIGNVASLVEIRKRAYEIYLERMGIHGWDQDDWLQAERELAKLYAAT
jgi:hypothetical protein